LFSIGLTFLGRANGKLRSREWQVLLGNSRITELPTQALLAVN
jgi:hypothetical protein